MNEIFVKLIISTLCCHCFHNTVIIEIISLVLLVLCMECKRYLILQWFMHCHVRCFFYSD